MSPPTNTPAPKADSAPNGTSLAPKPQRWPLWLALAVQIGTVVLTAAGLLGARAAAGAVAENVLISVGLAAVIVGLAGALALVIASWAGNPQQAASFVLAGMLVRLFVPLAAIVIVPKHWPELVEAGFRDQLLILYLVALAVETYAAIRVTGMPPPRFKAK